ncbi:hypothetical protein N7490_008114 [Penicillium lividum]|nr:hypothetical protein N7490_008114 [Penicillium lividum]
MYLGNKWTGNYLDSHTNLTEIKSALDLVWRNKVKSGQVVLGLAFYGRSFTLDSTECTSPGCTYASAGTAGPCSKTDGILMNKEIDDIASDKNLEPTLDKSAAVQILTWDDQWVTYDDEDTFKLKIEFAQSECLGGVMVWALTHDTADGKYSNALASLSGRSSNFVQRGTVINGKTYDTHTEKKQYQQCKWSSCGAPCPSGYAMVIRGDNDDGDLMMDETECDNSIHTFCCPTATKIPKCGWYTHNNGKCDPQCPSGMIEVGGNSKYCNNDKYQAACCELGSDSISLYNTLEWSDWPSCDKGECPFVDSSKSTVLTQSAEGSGGATCHMRHGLPRSSDDPLMDWQERKLCYGGQDKKSWTSCEWYMGEGWGTPDGQPTNHCSGSCPNDKVQLALDTINHSCYGNGGAAAFCCASDYYTEKTTQTVHVSDFGKSLNEWIEDPNCPDDDDSSSLEKRGDAAALLKDYNLIWDDLTTMFRQQELGIDQVEWASDWDDVVTVDRPNMTMDALRAFNSHWAIYRKQGPAKAARVVLCNLDLTQSRLEEDDSLPSCGGSLCVLDEDLCPPDDDLDNPYSDQRGGSSGDHDGLKRQDFFPDQKEQHLHLFEKRSDRQVTLTCPGQSPSTQSFTIANVDYYSCGSWDYDNDVYDLAFDFEDIGDCANAQVSQYSLPTGRWFATEHIIEIQMMKQFFGVTTSGILVSGASATTFTPVPCRYYVKEKALRQQLQGIEDVTFTGGIDSPQPEVRIMDALGSKTNTGNFVLLQEDINGMKARIMVGGTIHTDDKMNGYLNAKNYVTAILEIKTAIAVYVYLANVEVKTRMRRIIYDVRQQLALADAALSTKYPEEEIDLAAA